MTTFERAMELLEDDDFRKCVVDQLGHACSALGRSEPANWWKYLWDAAYSEARYEVNREMQRRERQAEADYVDELMET